MLIMVSNASGIEVGLLAGKYPGRIGHLYSPGGERGPWIEIPYGIDCGTYAIWLALQRGELVEWSEEEWLALLRWAVLSGISPLWAVVPDVVANRLATLEWWKRYSPVVRKHGFRPAFVIQDGMTFDDVPDVPDDECMLFLGGSDVDDWKDNAIGSWCRRFPNRVHVGRVNYWDRLVRCYRAGAVSVDGTGWFRKGRTIGSSQANDLRKFLRETSNTNEPLRAVA